MTISLIAVIALVVLPIVLLFTFAGCVGDSPDTSSTPPPPPPPPPQGGAASGGAATNASGTSAPPAPAPTYADLVLNPALDAAGFWRLGDPVNPNDGDKATDSGPKKLHGSYVKLLPTAIEQQKDGVAPPDKAVLFLGTEGYVDVPYSANLQLPGDFTLECWVWPSALPAAREVIAGAYEVENGVMTKGVCLSLLTDAGALQVEARISMDTGVKSLAATLGGVGMWHHVAVTFEKTNQGKAILYIDGQPIAEQNLDGKRTLNALRSLRIGAGQLEGNAGAPPGSAGHYFSGHIDEVALYYKPLPLGEFTARIAMATK